MIDTACSAGTSSTRMVTVPTTASLMTMLILAGRARRRKAAPTSSPWNSRTPTPPLSDTLSGSTGPADVVEVVVVAVVAGTGEVAAFEVEAWTSKRLSLLVDGPVGSGGVTDLVLASVTGAMEAAGLEL